MNAKRLTIIISLAALTAAAAMAARPESLIAKGNAAYEKGEYEKAEQYYRDAINRDPGSAAACHNLGTALAKLGKTEDAAKMLEQAASMPDSPNQANSYVNLGLTRAKAGAAQGGPVSPESVEQLEQAKQALRQAIIIDPNDKDAIHNYQAAATALNRLKQQQQQQQNQQNQQQEKQDKQDKQQQGQSGQSGQQGQQGQQDQQGQQKQDQQGKKQQNQNQGQQNKDSQSSQNEGLEQQNKQDQQNQLNEQNEEGRDQKDAPDQNKRDADKDKGREGQDESGLENEKSDGVQDQQDNAQGQPAAPPGDPGRQLSSEEMDAMRVLNALEKEKPEQYKKLFQFMNPGREKRLDKDW